MEAFALGRAVVSTTIAGIPELVVPEENGWLVPAGNVAEFVAAMRAVIDAPPERLDEMGRCGQRRVRQSHLASTEALNLLALLEDSLGLSSNDHRPVTQ